VNRNPLCHFLGLPPDKRSLLLAGVRRQVDFVRVTRIIKATLELILCTLAGYPASLASRPHFCLRTAVGRSRPCSASSPSSTGESAPSLRAAGRSCSVGLPSTRQHVGNQHKHNDERLPRVPSRTERTDTHLRTHLEAIPLAHLCTVFTFRTFSVVSPKDLPFCRRPGHNDYLKQSSSSFPGANRAFSRCLVALDLRPRRATTAARRGFFPCIGVGDNASLSLPFDFSLQIPGSPRFFWLLMEPP